MDKYRGFSKWPFTRPTKMLQTRQVRMGLDVNDSEVQNADLQLVYLPMPHRGRITSPPAWLLIVSG